MKHVALPVLALAFTLALVSSGCQTHKDTGAYPPLNTEGSNLETKAKFVLLGQGAQESVTCAGLQERTLSDGRLEVVANIRNRENRRIQVQINCVFKDEQGFPLNETSFETLILTENAMEGIKFTSLDSKAKAYTIRVRQAR
jgi:hypothetical protein